MREKDMHGLEFCFNMAMAENIEYVGVVIKMEGFPQTEVIINRFENFEKKLEYYKNTYDENLKHKFAEGISIINYAYGYCFESINEELNY